jgi:hypothetical protein
LAALSLSSVSSQQIPNKSEVRLPSGKLQRDEILKAEYKQSLRDVDEILTLAGAIKEEMTKNDYHVLSISSLKKAEQIEKLAKKIRKRMEK